MSKLGKIFLYIAAAGGVAALVAGYMAYQKIGANSAQLSTVQSQKQAAIVKATQAEKDAKAAADAQKTAEDNLKTAQNDLDDEKEKLTAAQKAQDDLKASLATANANVDKATADLKHYQDTLGGMSAEDAKAAIQKAQDDKTAAETEQKILADQLQALNKKIADIEATINKGPDKMPPGISGKVTNVNRPWNFVVLDVGLANGVVPKGELIVYRGNRFLGKVRVTSVEENTSVADILPATKGDIQIGDNVLN